MKFKEFLAKQLIHKDLHFKCDCIFHIDTKGTVVDYEIVDGEIIFKVKTGDKIMSIGENHPGLEIEL